ncbi:hypothetical protein HG535_0D00660 [Zygotorulaspora mrakii]|uniref:Aminopeptidase n=1 Tax=Zygotorulaspora mrakii TaxID=42260 RepID=A0A7H9B318_ZYGMR|nr:uncharacterized protein HG535_0D00660 [Zygotorulaspora mrakii]QLG72359.1 hypothetical protein HG535_0D00660 [Zygotorulaspora mrakii]
MSELLAITNAVVPSHYELHLDINPLKTNFRGSARISLKPTNLAACSIQDLKLHSKNLVILSASLCESKVEHPLDVTYDKSEEVVIFNCQEQILFSPDRKLFLHLDYVGRINAIKTYQDETAGVFKTNFMDPKTGKSNNMVIATHCQPYFARSIFPCVDEPSLKTTFQLTIKTLSRFKVISNTSKVSSSKVGNSDQKLTVFGITPLMVTSIFGFVVGDLEMSRTEVHSNYSPNKMPLSIYSPSNIENAAFALDTVQKYIPILEEFFDKKCPLDKLDFVLLPFLKDMAMENFGLITVQMNHLLLTPTVLANNDVRQQVQQLIVHELVHQWMGNYLSFQSFEYLWFNESFATWCACEVLEKSGDLPNYWTSKAYLVDQTGTAMSSDSDSHTLSIAAASLKATMNSPSQTKDLFDAHSYAKGIAILRGMSLSTGEEFFKKALQKVFKDESLHKNSIKPINIIYHMANTLKSQNISNHFSSWCRTAGLPIVSVELIEESNKTKTKLVQHRYITSGDTDYEDVPYSIPLFIQLPNTELDTKHILMTDRTLKIDYPILLCNHESQGYYHVSYESDEFYKQINQHLTNGDLSEIDLVKIFTDLQYYIGDSAYQKPIHLSGLQNLLQHLSSDEVDLKRHAKYWLAMRSGLIALGKVEQLSAANGNFAHDYIYSVVTPLIKKINWPVGKFEEGTYSSYQLDCMSKLLFMGRELPNICELCHNYFNHILQGPPSSVPIEIVESVFAVISQSAKNTKQWKRLFELANSCEGIKENVSFLNINTPVHSDALQFYAINYMCFSKNFGIIKKTLEFIAANLEISGIDSALLGLTYNAYQKPKGDQSDCQIREIVWEWFRTHFDVWVRSCVRKDASSDNKRTSLSSIAFHVFKMFAADEEIVDEFLEITQDSFLDILSAKDYWEIVKSTHSEDKQLLEKTMKYDVFN